VVGKKPTALNLVKEYVHFEQCGVFEDRITLKGKPNEKEAGTFWPDSFAFDVSMRKDSAGHLVPECSDRIFGSDTYQPFAWTSIQESNAKEIIVKLRMTQKDEKIYLRADLYGFVSLSEEVPQVEPASRRVLKQDDGPAPAVKRPREEELAPPPVAPPTTVTESPPAKKVKTSA